MTPRRRAQGVASAAVLCALAVPGIACGGGTVAAGASSSVSAPAPPVSTALPARRHAAARSMTHDHQHRPLVAKPVIRHRFIPLDTRRREETAAYALRHYGRAGWTIARPRVIVEHLTENDSVDATYATFAPDVPDVELHELPGLCAQFVIGPDGAFYQFAPITFMCRHTVGLNWAAIGIEHVAYGEQDVFARRAQLDASLRLTRWLRCRYRIPVRDVIGHAESLGSPYHRERVASLRTQTHADWQPWAMERYRALLRARGGC